MRLAQILTYRALAAFVWFLCVLSPARVVAAPIKSVSECTPSHAELQKPETGLDLPVLRALELERRCRNGHEADCWKVMSSFEFMKQCAGLGDAVSKEFLDRACDARCREACFARADIVTSRWYFEAPDGSTLTPERLRRDFALSYPLYRRACEVGHQEGCAYFGWFTRDGIGTRADAAAGVAILVRSCSEFQRSHRGQECSSSCRWAAKSYERGFGVPRDYSMARTLQHASCGGHLDCDELFLISSSTNIRHAAWFVEILTVVLTNGAALWSMSGRFRRLGSRGRGLVVAVLAIVGALAAVVVGIEVAYFFWGSSMSSPLWLFIALPLGAVPVGVAFHQTRSVRTSEDTAPASR